MSKTDKPEYDKNLITYILLGKFKGHSTFRVVFTGKDLKTLESIKTTHKDQVEAWKYACMDNLTGEIQNLKRSL